MSKRLKFVLLLFVVVLIVIVYLSMKKKEEDKYQVLEDYSKLAILVDGVVSTEIPTDKYYYMSSNCNGMDLDWDVLEKKLKVKAITSSVTSPSCTVKFESVTLDIKYGNTTNFNPTGDLFIVEKNCGDAVVTYTNKLNIRFNTKPSNCTIKLKASNGNPPLLVAGMTPVKWDANNNEILTTENDSEWYNYGQKKWANAKTTDGSYWVWIPRYAYKMLSGYHKNSAGSIDVEFLTGTTNTSDSGTVAENSGYVSGTKDTTTNYFLHPAFTFGSSEVAGIWIAKFESSVSTVTDACYTNASATNCNKNTLTPASKPNATSWRYIQIGNMFDVSYNMRNNSMYGWNGTNIDTHLVKNTEWASVSYLSWSLYGANTEVWTNNCSSYITGCAGNSSSSSSSSSCLNAYNTAGGIKASTTFNITGIYDASGRVWEYTAAYVNNGNSSLTTYGNQIVNADAKYKDIYTKASSDSSSNNYTSAKNTYGDAVYETSSGVSSLFAYAWNGDFSSMPATSSPWFNRSGFYGHSGYAGTFNFGSNSGATDSNLGFRIAAIVP